MESKHSMNFARLKRRVTAKVAPKLPTYLKHSGCSYFRLVSRMANKLPSRFLLTTFEKRSRAIEKHSDRNIPKWLWPFIPWQMQKFS